MREKLIELLDHATEAFRFDAWENTDRIADHLIANGVTVQQWIPVSEKLPEDNERVIAYRPMEADASAYKYCVMWGWSVKGSMRHGGITHWMPLPEPPKEE